MPNVIFSPEFNHILGLTPLNRKNSQKTGKSIRLASCVGEQRRSDLGFAGHESPDCGPQTPAWLVTSQEVTDITGANFEYMRQVLCQFIRDNEQIKRLYEVCKGYV
ncbi:MAG: hypothetical protein ABUK01_02320 [Leptospirales bacterium]